MMKMKSFESRSKEIYDYMLYQLRMKLGVITEDLKLVEDREVFGWEINFSNSDLDIRGEADAHWLNWETNFGIVSEYSVSKNIKKERIEEVCDIIADEVKKLIIEGAKRVDTYRSNELISTAYYTGNEQVGAEIIHKIRFFGHKETKTKEIKYPKFE